MPQTQAMMLQGQNGPSGAIEGRSPPSINPNDSAESSHSNIELDFDHKVK